MRPPVQLLRIALPLVATALSCSDITNLEQKDPSQILSKDVLTIPTIGTINVHASLLPKYRGAAPVAYAILNGEKQTGVTIIKVTPGLDSGDMILQLRPPLAPAHGRVRGRVWR